MKKTNPEKLKVLHELTRPEIVMAVARQPRTGRIFFGGSDSAVYSLTLDPKPGKPVELGRHGSFVTGLAIAGSSLISGGYDGRLMWWNVETGSPVRTVLAHQKYIRGVKATPDGSLVASVADDMVCRIWDATSGKLVHELVGHAELTPQGFTSMLFACAISNDGRFIATGDKVGHVIVWELETGKQVAAMDAPTLYTWDQVQRLHSIGGIRSLAFSLDGQILNIDHLDSKPRIEFFDWRKGQRTGEFVSDAITRGLVEHLEFPPGGEWLIAAGGYQDGFMLFYDLANKKILAQEKVNFYVHDLALNEAGDTIYAVGHEKMALMSVAG
jgi:WD40 repeat protein